MFVELYIVHLCIVKLIAQTLVPIFLLSGPVYDSPTYIVEGEDDIGPLTPVTELAVDSKASQPTR